MRRGPGIAAIKKKNLAQARYKDKGSELAEDQLAQLSKQLDTFKENLEEFAAKHKEKIRKNPEFRVQFQEMCASIGVDPLASGKGFWSELLGVGDFYYELGVKIIEVCLAASHRNGGLMELEELQRRLVTSSAKTAQNINSADLLTAIKKLRVLGNGFRVIPLGQERYLVQSVPGELTMDHTAVLQCAERLGYVTEAGVREQLHWEPERACRTLDYLVKEGLAWVDDQGTSERQFWFPSLYHECAESTT